MGEKKVKKLKTHSKHYKGWYYFLRGILLPLGKFLFPTTVLGRSNIPADDKFILAGNHRSWMDLPLLGFNVYMYMHYASKEEHLNNRILRWIFRKIFVFTVDRQGSDLMFMRNVISALNKNEPIAIFPEGTRNRDDKQEMLELKNGTALFAYKTGAAIVPFVIYKKPKIFMRNYIYIAKPLILTETPQGGMIDRAKLDEAAVMIKARLVEAMEAVDEIVVGKKARAVKKAEKPAIKRMKKERKLIKKARKAARKDARRAEKAKKRAERNK